MAPLELAQAHPLRLADRLALRFDLDQVAVAHRRVRFFLRLTLRGAAGWALGCSAAALAPSPAGRSFAGASFGGVRDERFGGATGFGISRRVINPCPTVHRFVVTQ